jgi:hypothetical protein
VPALELAEPELVEVGAGVGLIEEGEDDALDHPIPICGMNLAVRVARCIRLFLSGLICPRYQ